jgi:medium-chain acyl-[acyl-carrier-protein] hydrolase
VYRTWPDGLPFGVEVCAVQLPGREKRIMEPPYTRLAPLVQKLALVLIPYLDRPFTFFGHSMGALISFELVRQLRRQYGLGPAHLFVAGHRAPQIPNPGLPIYQLPEADFIARLRCFGGLPEVVLQDAELKDVFVPLLRADIELCETYVYVTGAPFDCPISAFGGLEDSTVNRDNLAAWRAQTLGSFSLRMFPGSHFFLQSAREPLLQALSGELEQALGEIP